MACVKFKSPKYIITTLVVSVCVKELNLKKIKIKKEQKITLFYFGQQSWKTILLVCYMFQESEFLNQKLLGQHPSKSLGSYFLVVAYGFPNDEKTQQQRKKKWKFEFEDSAGN